MSFLLFPSWNSPLYLLCPRERFLESSNIQLIFDFQTGRHNPFSRLVPVFEKWRKYLGSHFSSKQLSTFRRVHVLYADWRRGTTKEGEKRAGRWTGPWPKLMVFFFCLSLSLVRFLKLSQMTWLWLVVHTSRADFQWLLSFRRHDYLRVFPKTNFKKYSRHFHTVTL